MERQSPQPLHNGVIEIGGVVYREQPNGEWLQAPHETPQQPTSRSMDMGETAYCVEDIRRLQGIVAAADVAHDEIDRKAAAAAALLEERQAALAARRDQADRQRRLEQFHGWNPAENAAGEREIAQLNRNSLIEPAVWSGDLYPISELDVEIVKPKKRTVRRGVAIVALSGVVLSGAGTAAFEAGYPMKWFAGQEKTAAADVAQLPLSAAKEQLIDAFGGCLDDQGNGTPLTIASLQTATDVSYPITTVENKQVTLAAADKSTGRTSIKPVVKLTDAAADYTACVAPADRANVLKIDGNKIEINESLISPQGHVAIRSYLRAMMLNESDDSTALDTTGVLTQLVSAKTISAAEGKRVTDAYSADATAKEEVRLAGALSAKTLANDGDIYAQEAKSRIDAAIKQAVSDKVKQLHNQGTISVDAADIVMTGTLSRPITIKNNDPTPAPKMPFTETDAPRVLNYTFKAEGTK